jgi:hypothetical protein
MLLERATDDLQIRGTRGAGPARGGQPLRQPSGAPGPAHGYASSLEITEDGGE